MDRANATPIIVLTGFLGSGKSTLLKSLLSEARFANAGVVINEYGDVAIDHDLLTEGRPQVMATSTGCLCCTAAADIRASLAEIHHAAQQAKKLPLDCVVVETTGLADPAPVVNQLVAGALPAFGLRDHTVARHYQLCGVVTTFDTVEGPGTLTRHPEAAKQLAFADRILLTKSDLLPAAEREAQLAAVHKTIRRINRDASIEDVNAPGFDLSGAFAARAYAPADLAGDVDAWLGHDHHHGHGHDHHHDHDHAGAHDHDHDHHHHTHGDSGIETLSIVRDERVEKEALAHVLDLASMLYGDRLLRLKGLVAFADEPENPYVLQVVQHVVHPLARLDAWPSADHRTRIVAITRSMEPNALEQLLGQAWTPQPA
ncbi:MAG: CobW family GTP-binding protein [Pseudomonadota bacterium]